GPRLGVTWGLRRPLSTLLPTDQHRCQLPRSARAPGGVLSEPRTPPTAAGPGGKPPRTRGGTASRAIPTARFALPLPAFLRRHNLQLWIGAIILGALVLLLAIGPLFGTDGANRHVLLDSC